MQSLTAAIHTTQNKIPSRIICKTHESASLLLPELISCLQSSRNISREWVSEVSHFAEPEWNYVEYHEARAYEERTFGILDVLLVEPLQCRYNESYYFLLKHLFAFFIVHEHSVDAMAIACFVQSVEESSELVLHIASTTGIS